MLSDAKLLKARERIKAVTRRPDNRGLNGSELVARLIQAGPSLYDPTDGEMLAWLVEMCREHGNVFDRQYADHWLKAKRSHYSDNDLGRAIDELQLMASLPRQTLSETRRVIGEFCKQGVAARNGFTYAGVHYVATSTSIRASLPV